ncbi:hypothetical protein [Methylovirgula sp. HY1]|uniref:hypothetical protein n=1 Tax=Methylovirgula sp. HY1 TaxID=2822761 RepID=UPI001C5BECD5|nr:hypothetical protein [Methylovirgula sp. HY1]QXX74739.1 hypothetical protein MHY1_01555 [Methylovirgula sp. HY1]
MPIYFGILNFGVLMLVAVEARKSKDYNHSAWFAIAAWAVLAWGIADFVWHLFRG